MKTKLNIFLAFFVLLAAMYVAHKGLLPGWNDTATDFNNYYTSAKLFQQGEPIHGFYSNQEFSDQAKQIGVENGAKFSPFPPPTAVLYWPVSFFNLLTAKRIWLVFNLVLFCLLPFRMKRYFKWNLLQNLSVLSLFAVPLSSNFHFGQFYLVTAFLLVESVGYFFTTKKTVLPSILIGCLAAVKYIPILFIGYLLKISKEALKPMIVIASTLVIITFVFMLVDSSAYVAYLNDLGGHINGDLSGQGKYAIGFQSADALLNNLFVMDYWHNPNPFLNLSALKPIIKWLLIGAVAASCWVMLKREKYAFSTSVVSIGIVGAFVLIPASASYHFLVLILPIFFILKWLIEEKGMRERVITVVLILGAFSVQAHQIPTVEKWPVLDLLIHFPRLWFILALFTYLIFCKRKTAQA